MNDWIHDDIINLGEQLETLVDICVDDISRVLLDEFKNDIERIDTERKNITSGSLATSPSDDMSSDPKFMLRISGKIDQLIPLATQLYDIRDKLNMIKRTKRLQTDEDYDEEWAAAEGDEDSP